MTALQQRELELLRLFIQLCGQLGLRYYLVCGSALGAVKYGGFIPWDDDVDVAMPREDYERFLEQAPGLLPQGIFLQNYRTDPAFPQIFSKLRNSNTTYIEKSAAALPMNHGICIDIFPLDGYPAEPRAQRRLEFRKKLYIHLLGSAFAPPEPLKSRIFYKLKRVAGFHKRTAQIAKRYDQLIRQYSLSGSHLWCSHGSWQGKLEYAPREQYGAGALATFEGLTVRVPARTHEYLTQKYGDYTQDPPREDQIGHHYCAVCDVNRPYTDYLQGKAPVPNNPKKPAMKVLYINAVCGTGSTGNMIAGLVEKLRAESGRGCVAFGVGDAHKVRPEEAFKFNSKLGYYLHNALSRITDHTGRYSRLQTWRLIRKIREFDPDIIHLHNLHGYYVNYKILFHYLKTRETPVIWTLHDCWVMTGHCTHFVGADCNQWQSGCERCPLLREYPICYTRGDVKGNYKHKKAAFTGLPDLTIVTPSRWLGDLVKQSYLGKYPVRVIPNGIDTGVFHPRGSDFRERKGLTGKKVILGVANVWGPKKGLEDFYRLARLLPEDYRVVLVGLTEQQLTNLPGNILGIPRTRDADKLAQIYSTADVFVNPTWEDTFPTVNLEAQACGTPVISYAVCGCPETVQHGCGETVPRGDVEGLCRKITQWCERSEPIPVQPRRVSKDTCFDAYLALYRQVLNESERNRQG